MLIERFSTRLNPQGIVTFCDSKGASLSCYYEVIRQTDKPPIFRHNL